MNFSNYAFFINSGYGNAFTVITLYIPQSKNKEFCTKVRFDCFEIHTNPLDPYLIGIAL